MGLMILSTSNRPTKPVCVTSSEKKVHVRKAIPFVPVGIMGREDDPPNTDLAGWMGKGIMGRPPNLFAMLAPGDQVNSEVVKKSHGKNLW